MPLRNQFNLHLARAKTALRITRGLRQRAGLVGNVEHDRDECEALFAGRSLCRARHGGADEVAESQLRGAVPSDSVKLSSRLA